MLGENCLKKNKSTGLFPGGFKDLIENLKSFICWGHYLCTNSLDNLSSYVLKVADFLFYQQAKCVLFGEMQGYLPQNYYEALFTFTILCCDSLFRESPCCKISRILFPVLLVNANEIIQIILGRIPKKLGCQCFLFRNLYQSLIGNECIIYKVINF